VKCFKEVIVRPIPHILNNIPVNLLRIATAVYKTKDMIRISLGALLSLESG